MLTTSEMASIFHRSRTLTVNILFIMPLNEPFEVIVNADLSPELNKLNTQTRIKKVDCVYPTGLLSIASYLKKHLSEASISIVDCNVEINKMAELKGGHGFTREEYFEHCLNAAEKKCPAPDLIGLSLLFCSNFADLEPFAASVKKRWPESFMIAGGHLPSAIYQRIFRDGSALDAICFGEGEIPVLDLCYAMQQGKKAQYLSEDTCWITPEKLNRIPDFKPEAKLLEDLDEIPPFDFNMLHAPEAYKVSSRYFFVIESTEDLPEMLIFSTRGCPYHCVFCASQNVHGHKVRRYSTERIKSDILYYNRNFGIKRFVFYDDHFLSSKKRAIEILEFVGSLNLRAEIPTPAFFAIDDEVAAAMKKAGINEVNITIESGNADTLKNIINKPGNLEHAKRAVDELHKVGITAISNILIGLPGETKEAIEESIRYLASTDVNWFQCFVTAPLPGSRMWDICEKNGYFTELDPYRMDFKKCVVRTPDFDPEYIEHKVYQMNLYLNFVNNYDMRSGNYAEALKLFERILNTVIGTHAFAMYFAAKCCEKLGLHERYQHHKTNYYKMLEKYPFWKKWRDEFALEELA